MEAEDKTTEDEEIIDSPQEEVVEETKQDDSPQSGIEELKAQLKAFEERNKRLETERDEQRRWREAEAKARSEAERRAQSSAEAEQITRRHADGARYDAVVNALSAAQEQLKSHKGALKQAMTDGDAERVAELSAEIGLTAARVRQLEEGKSEMDARIRDNPPGPPQQPRPSQDQQREAFLQRLPPRSAAWVRQNYDRYFNDTSFQQAVAGADNLARSRGIAPESDEYFRFVEEMSGMRPAEGVAPPPVVTPPPAPPPAAPRRAPTPAAPAAGSTQSAPKTPPGKQIQLTAQEREFCRLNEISEANYAKQKADLLEEGLIGTRH